MGRKSMMPSEKQKAKKKRAGEMKTAIEVSKALCDQSDTGILALIDAAKKRKKVKAEVVVRPVGLKYLINSEEGRCLFCLGKNLMFQSITYDDIPTGFTAISFRCKDCGRTWREVSKIEEVVI